MSEIEIVRRLREGAECVDHGINVDGFAAHAKAAADLIEELVEALEDSDGHVKYLLERFGIRRDVSRYSHSKSRAVLQKARGK